MTTLRLGDRVENYGTVAAIGFTGGERYYWFVDGYVVSMMPAALVEAMARQDETGGEDGHGMVGD